MQLDVETSIGNGLLEQGKGGREGLGSVLKGFGSSVRRQDHTIHAHVELGPEHLERIAHRGRAVVNARQDVAVHIGVIKQSGVVFFLLKKIKHVVLNFVMQR